MTTEITSASPLLVPIVQDEPIAATNRFALCFYLGELIAHEAPLKA